MVRPIRLGAAIVSASGCVAVAVGASGASAAVVAGKAADGTRYRLDGSRLVVHLRQPVPRATVRCGDLAGLTPGRGGLIFADLVKRAIRSRRGSSAVRVRFARNIAARVSLCYITRPHEDPAVPSQRRRARMQLRSGAPPGCQTGRYELTQLDVGSVHILIASRGGLAWRACRPGDARPTPLFTDVIGNARVVTGPFVVTGDVLGWHVYHETRDGHSLSRVGATDLARRRRIGTITPRIEASSIAVSSSGILACIERPSFDDNAPATILARRLDGRIVTLDSSPDNALTNLRVDGTTVSWLHGGEPRSASVAS